MSAPSQPDENPSVLVVVTTFRRTELLAPLIGAIRANLGTLAPRVRIALVDNDPEQSAAEKAHELGVEYIHEPTPGIAAARQAALDGAHDGELVAMVDDDVVPQSGWLEALVSVWALSRPAVVMGYVDYVWPEGTDPWIIAGGFMRRRRRVNGQRLEAMATGNVLIDSAQVRNLGVRFDATLGLAGGEDMLFGRALLAAGGEKRAAEQHVFAPGEAERRIESNSQIPNLGGIDEDIPGGHRFETLAVHAAASTHETTGDDPRIGALRPHVVDIAHHDRGA